MMSSFMKTMKQSVCSRQQQLRRHFQVARENRIGDGPSIAGEAAQAGARPGSESSGKEPPRELCLRPLEKKCSPLDSVSSHASHVPGLRGHRLTLALFAEGLQDAHPSDSP